MALFLARRGVRVVGAQRLLTSSRRARSSSAIVSPEWVRESDTASGAVRVIDCGHPVEFQRAHIPNATSFYGFKATTLKDTRGGTGVISKPEFEELLDVMGIDGDSTLVFYDDELSISSTRAWWVFLHYGFPKDKLKVLNGGWKQWVHDIKEVSADLSSFRSPAHGSVSLTTAGKLIGLDEVQSALLASSAEFVDARSRAEYVGAQDNGNRRVGHVPGAINFEWKDGVDLTRNGLFKSKEELEKALVHERELTEDRSTPLIAYCQRGIRAAHAAFVLQEILGYEDVKIYEDSMLQYLNRDDTAIERSD